MSDVDEFLYITEESNNRRDFYGQSRLIIKYFSEPAMVGVALGHTY